MLTGQCPCPAYIKRCGRQGGVHRRREKGEGRKEKGEGRKEKGEGRRG